MNDMRLLSFIAAGLIVLAGNIASARATEQIPDRILYEGEQRPLHTEPLMQSESLPPQWREVLRTIPLGRCSANWRGYQVYWSLRDGQLYLDRMVQNACSTPQDPVSLEAFFPDQSSPYPADWYSGELLIPLGQPDHDHQDTDVVTRDSRYRVVRIRHGRVAGQETVSHETLQRRRNQP